MGKFAPGGNRRHAFINRGFLRLAGAGYLIPSPVEPRGKAMSIDRILIARILFTLMTAVLCCPYGDRRLQ
jgi:hypothetical protein